MFIDLEEREENDMLDYTYTIEEAKKEIKESVSVYFTKGANGYYVIPQERQNPFYLVGAPGIGKTQMVREIAEEIGCGFFATSLTHHTRNSILGLPVIRGEEVKYTEYTMPEILAVIEEKYQAGETEGLLLLDEFASMPESLVAPMLAFLQNKTIGNHKLPEGWVLILASNPPEYNRTARTFDAAIMDRVRTMQIVYDQKDFLEYGEVARILCSYKACSFIAISNRFFMSSTTESGDMMRTQSACCMAHNSVPRAVARTLTRYQQSGSSVYSSPR